MHSVSHRGAARGQAPKLESHDVRMAVLPSIKARPFAGYGCTDELEAEFVESSGQDFADWGEPA